MKPFYLVIATLITLSASLLAGLSPEHAKQEVVIKGEMMNAGDVLRQAEQESGLIFSFPFKDKRNHKQNYRHFIKVEDVIREFISYHREFNNLDLELVARSHGRYAFRKKMDKAPKVEVSKAVETPSSQEPLDTEFIAPDDFAEPAAAPASSNATGKPLKVELIDRNRSSSSSLGSHFDLEDPDSLPEDLPKSEEIQPVKSLKDRLQAKGSEVKEGIVRVDPIDMGFSGLVSGFLSPALVPLSDLNEGGMEIRSQLSLQVEEGDDTSLRHQGSYDGEWVQWKWLGRMHVMKDVEASLELGLGGHTGDFNIAGISSGDIGVSLLDTTIGIRYTPSIAEAMGGRLITGLRIKVPTGSSDDLTGTDNSDVQLSAAWLQDWGHFESVAQLGLTAYGDHEAFSGVDTRTALSFNLGALGTYQGDYQYSAFFVYSQNPFDDSGLPNYLEDDIAYLQISGGMLLMDQDVGLTIKMGLTDSAADFGLALNWKMELE